MRRRNYEKSYCEWCGHEITFNGADIPYYYDDDNDKAHLLCVSCFHADDEALREMMESLSICESEFFGEYNGDDF